MSALETITPSFHSPRCNKHKNVIISVHSRLIRIWRGFGQKRTDAVQRYKQQPFKPKTRKSSGTPMQQDREGTCVTPMQLSGPFTFSSLKASDFGNNRAGLPVSYRSPQARHVTDPAMLRAVGCSALSPRGGSTPSPKNIQMPRGVWWLDKAAHNHDVVYGQVVGSISTHLVQLLSHATTMSAHPCVCDPIVAPLPFS